MESVKFAGFVESRDERAAEVEKELGVLRYKDDASLLADVDAVNIVVPTPAHYDVARKALEAGKHVFIEKPITATLEQADELLDTARKSGALVQIGHVERFNRAVRAALPYVSRPRFIESERLATFNLRGSDVAVVLDLMIHDIDLIQSLVGAPIESIDAVGTSVFSAGLDIANARIRYANGCVANTTASRVSMKVERKLRLFQDDAYISIDLQQKVLTIVRKPDESAAAAPGSVEAGTGRRIEMLRPSPNWLGCDSPKPSRSTLARTCSICGACGNCASIIRPPAKSTP